MAEAYSDFASVYDTFMDDTPYEEWADFIQSMIEKYGISKPFREANESGTAEIMAEALDTVGEEAKADNPQESGTALLQEKNLVVDLGCGTGTLTELLYRKGYDMIGVDYSEEMLNIAMKKKGETPNEILYLCQDMRELDLYSTVGTIISVCDSLNYILEEEELLEVFRLADNYLYPGGMFLFDFNTVYKYQEIIGDRVIAENREECSFIWDNFYHEDEHINEYDITFFVREQEIPGEHYRKFEETHYQRGYTLEEMKSLLEKAGLLFVTAMDADTHGEVSDTSERIYVIARECKKGINRT